MKGTGEPVGLTMRTMCARAGLHTSDRLLLEAVREVTVVNTKKSSATEEISHSPHEVPAL